MKKELNLKEKKVLLKHFLKDEILVKAVVDTLNPNELNKYLDSNLDTLLASPMEKN